MQNTAVATIDLAAVRHNLAQVRQLCPNSKVMATVKADAYGHGVLQVAKALDRADGLAVARLHEALALRRSGVTKRLLLLSTLLDQHDVVTCSEHNIDVVAHDQVSVRLIAERAQIAPLRVWLKLDSGMHRAGLSPDEFVDADRRLSRISGVLEVIHMSHFSNSGDSAARERQLATFSICHSVNVDAKVSVANSGAILVAPHSHRDWVRPGIMLYGDNPIGQDHNVCLLPAMTLRSYIVAVREISAGEPVGYNGRWASSRPSRIGMVGIGYADGYPRHARNGTPVYINGVLAPLIGQVSMDSLMVDLTDCGHVAVGDEVILWGVKLPVAVIADHADTISYELLTRISPRVTRKYVDRSIDVDQFGSSGAVARELRS